MVESVDCRSREVREAREWLCIGEARLDLLWFMCSSLDASSKNNAWGCNSRRWSSWSLRINPIMPGVNKFLAGVSNEV